MASIPNINHIWKSKVKIVNILTFMFVVAAADVVVVVVAVQIKSILL